MKSYTISSMWGLIFLLMNRVTAQTPYYTNINLTNDPSHDQSECSIALHPLDRNMQLVTWNAVGRLLSNSVN